MKIKAKKARIKTNEAHRIEQLIEKSLAFDWPCILCKTPTRGRGMFIPDKPEQWGALPGKGRALIYGICDKCHSKSQEIEAELEKKVSEEMDAMRTAGQSESDN